LQTNVFKWSNFGTWTQLKFIFRSKRKVAQEEVKTPLSMANALSLGMTTTSRFVGKMHNLQKPKPVG
jgi:hypothetical protein